MALERDDVGSWDPTEIGRDGLSGMSSLDSKAWRAIHRHADLFEALLVRRVLFDDTCDWMAHSLGMFRLVLADDIRINVWDGRVLGEGVAQIHTHPYAMFESRVVCGEIENETYDERPPRPGEDPTHVEHYAATDGAGSTRLVVLERARFYTTKAGDTYAHGGKPHHTRAVNGTITAVMTHDPLGGSKAYVPIGVSPVGARVRPATAYEIAAMRFVAKAMLDARIRELGGRP